MDRDHTPPLLNTHDCRRRHRNRTSSVPAAGQRGSISSSGRQQPLRLRRDSLNYSGRVRELRCLLPPSGGGRLRLAPSLSSFLFHSQQIYW
ncbi:hypothetical protein GBAR_LOCUS27793 [Geodia barretti]|uniref:Uncharacterized protein n=1 Tax=Geodia barretti TaxID=519541 RepID=A0AA35XH69_GEOBA|nr:hypothetical protein GBAR_LOCUS27793 [Geodia barretti]